MNITPEEYSKLAAKKEDRSPLLRNILCSFVVGGTICAIGQLFLNLYRSFDMEEQPARGLMSITMVFFGALFTGMHLYNKLAKYGGAGTIVPITGFANAIVSQAMEFKSEGLILGVGAKMFSVAGPVLVYGITAGIVYGIILFIVKAAGG